MYQIFIVCNKDFGDIDKLEYADRDLANTVWKDFMRDGNPIITVNGNEFKVFNAPMRHQPENLKGKDWPKWAIREWNSRKVSNSGYLGAKLLDRDNIGCFELMHTTMLKEGMKRIERVFYTYKGVELFSVTEYD